MLFATFCAPLDLKVKVSEISDREINSSKILYGSLNFYIYYNATAFNHGGRGIFIANEFLFQRRYDL